MSRRIGLVAAVLLLLSAAGCNQTEPSAQVPDDQGTPAAEGTEVASGPTIVARAGPQMTATIAANLWAVVELDEIEGIVVPGGAQVVEYTEAAEDNDSQVVLLMEGADSDELRDWFETQFIGLGWGEPQLTDGSLVFRHLEQLSDRYARQGLKRTATVHLVETDEGIEIHLIVEEPARAE